MLPVYLFPSFIKRVVTKLSPVKRVFALSAYICTNNESEDGSPLTVLASSSVSSNIALLIETSLGILGTSINSLPRKAYPPSSTILSDISGGTLPTLSTMEKFLSG